MQKSLLLITLFIYSFIGISQTIPPSKALEIASKQYSLMHPNTKLNINPEIYKTAVDKQNEAAVYMISYPTKSGGFCLISAEERTIPVLGYSTEGIIDSTNFPIAYIELVNQYINEINYIRTHNLAASEEAKSYQLLYSGSESTIKTRIAKNVSPLVTTQWGQSPYVNELCPFDNDENKRCVTGCVATAMAQIMKYHNHPSRGHGSSSYAHPKYNTLSADYGATEYQWNSMPNKVESANNAVATLMSHCGISVEMNYGPGGSGAYTGHVANALKDYFGYQPSIAYKQKQDFSDSEWSALLKTELEANRPMEYKGSGNDGGHAFICDGYENDNYFHFNWGWNGYHDGFFYLNALNPGSYSFTSSQGAVIGIRPIPEEVELGLFKPLNIAPTTVIQGDFIEVEYQLENYSAAQFSGSICAKILDSEGHFLSTIETANGITINGLSHQNYSQILSRSELFGVANGTNKIALYYKQADKDWQLVTPSSYENPVNIHVSNNSSNTLSMATEMSINPVTVEQGRAFSISVTLKNNGSSDFYGSLSADFFQRDETTIGETVQQLDNISINSGNSKTITFSTSGMPIEEGEYLMSIWNMPEDGEWELVNPSNRLNPKIFTVSTPFLTADQYEDNNDEASAYNLLLSFSGDHASYSTHSANFHRSDDTDYFTFTLPGNYDYIVKPTLYDIDNQENSNQFTTDAMAQVYANQLWQEVTDDIPNQTIVKKGGKVTIKIFTKYVGTIGTYKMKLDISKQPIGINEIEDHQLKVYPNPVSSQLFFHNQGKNPYNEYIILSNTGCIMKQGKVYNTSLPQSFSVDELANGIYYIRFISGNQSTTKKLLIFHNN